MADLDTNVSFDPDELDDEELLKCVQEARWHGLFNENDVFDEALSLLRRGDLAALETLLEQQLPSGLTSGNQQQKYEAAMAAKRERAAP